MKRNRRDFAMMGGVLLLGFMATAVLSPLVSAHAKPSTVIRGWLIAVDGLCGPPLGSTCPAIAQAATGDTIGIAGSGTLDPATRSVSGGGTTYTCTGTDPSTCAPSGTWTAVKFLNFMSFGTTTIPGIGTFEGGVFNMKIQLLVGGTPVATGILEVTCLLGSPPPNEMEGVNLNVQGVTNFDKAVSGETLFIPS